MRNAIIENGIVVNVIVGSVEGSIECAEEVSIGWDYAGGTFICPAIDLAELKASKVAMLTGICSSRIVGGYVSNALGAPHTYPSGITDQINMMGSVTDSLLPGVAEDWSTPFWCRNGAGEWAFRIHDIAEIQQAGADGKAHVVQCQSVLEGLTAAVLAAETAEAVAAIEWPES